MRLLLSFASPSLVAALFLGLLAAHPALASGPVVGWGSDISYPDIYPYGYWYGQSIPPSSVDGSEGRATAIAAGGDHSCAIQAGTGAVVCWGEYWNGRDYPPPSVDGTEGTATAIAVGAGHTLAILTPECSDGLDNDGDGFTDFFGGDPGCANPDDSSENDSTLPCDDGIDNDNDGLIDFPGDPGCADLLDNSESPNPIQAELTLKIKLKFNKSSRDKILVKVKDWQLPAGVVPTDVTVNVGGAECSGTLDAEGKFQSSDRRDSITIKQSRKNQLWNIAVKRKNNDFAADLWDEGCADADNPKPGLPVTVPLTIRVGGVTYGGDVDLVYTSKLGRKGTAK